MENMNLALESLKQVLIGLNHPILKEVSKPLDINLIKDLLTWNKFGLEDNFLALYQFCNWLYGPKLLNEKYVELSSFGVLVDFRSLISIHAENHRDHKCWKKKLPLMTNKKGDFILIDMDVKSKSYGKLYACVTGDFMFLMESTSELVSVYDSIPSFIRTIVECYKTGTYQLEDRILRVDKEKEREISKALNPESDFWK